MIVKHFQCIFMSEYCFICDGSLSVEVTTKVKTRGIEKFVKSSDERKDGKAERHLYGVAEISVHEKCRKAYRNVKNYQGSGKKIPRVGKFSSSAFPNSERSRVTLCFWDEMFVLRGRYYRGFFGTATS